MIRSYPHVGTATGALLVAALAVAALAVAPAATAQTPTPTPVAPPSIVQVCAATGISQVDELLAGVDRGQLVGELAPLLTILVPGTDTAEVDGSLQLADVRQRLNCVGTPSSTPTATSTPTSAPSTTPRTASPATSSAPQPSTGFSQLTRVPVGSVETGGA